MGIFSKLFGSKNTARSVQHGETAKVEKARVAFSDMTLFELSSPQFKNLLTSKDDDGPFKEAYNFIAQRDIGDNYDKALQVITQNLATRERKDRLCELFANIYLNRKNSLSIGWYMQTCVLGSRSWVPYLMLYYAARALNLDEVAWRCLNACDVLDTGMKRMDKLETDIAGIVLNSNQSELISALKNFVKVLDPYLPLPNEMRSDVNSGYQIIHAASILL